MKAFRGKPFIDKTIFTLVEDNKITEVDLINNRYEVCEPYKYDFGEKTSINIFNEKRNEFLQSQIVPTCEVFQIDQNEVNFVSSLFSDDFYGVIELDVNSLFPERPKSERQLNKYEKQCNEILLDILQQDDIEFTLIKK